MSRLIESIKIHEGFSGEVYQDTLGFDTIGYGTKLPLSKSEAEAILEMRLRAKITELKMRKPIVKELSEERRQILAEMSYQLGVNGVVRFKKMWIAIEEGNYETARKEMLDSRWFNQTPSRARELADRMA